MKLRDLLGVLQHHLGHESTGLEVAPALQLEEVALGTDHGSLSKPFE
jgi:hypothetical protein